MPEPTETLGFVSLREGGNALLVSRSSDDRNSGGSTASSSGGVIYTKNDMPSLEELLEAHQVAFAILERPAPDATSTIPTEVVKEAPVGIPLARGGRVDDDDLVRVLASSTAMQPSGPSRDTVRERMAIVVATAITVAIAVAGAVLLVLGLFPTPRQPDPISALAVLLVGLGLVWTLVVALRAWPGRRAR